MVVDRKVYYSYTVVDRKAYYSYAALPSVYIRHLIYLSSLRHAALTALTVKHTHTCVYYKVEYTQRLVRKAVVTYTTAKVLVFL